MYGLYPRQLAYFLAVYEHRSLRSAAETIGISQPALSKSLQKLEQQLGVALFERRASGIQPTDFAVTLHHHAQSIYNEARYIELEAAAITSGRSGLLRIGAGPAWSHGYLPLILPRFQSRFANIRLEIETGVTDYLLPRLIGGEFDLFMGSLFGIQPSEDISLHPLIRTRMILVVRPEHPLLANAAITAANLLTYPWANFLHDIQGERELSLFFSRRTLPTPNITLRMSSLATMLSLIRHSDHIAYIADSLSDEAQLHGLSELPLPLTIWQFDSGVAVRRSVVELKPIRYLLELIEEIFDHHRRA